MYKNKLTGTNIASIVATGLAPNKIAKDLGVSHSAVTRKCKKETGYTPSQYRSICIAKDFDRGLSMKQLKRKYNLTSKAINDNIDRGVYYGERKI